MRYSKAVLACGISLLLIFTARQHLTVLYWTLRTYATFHSSLRVHPEILHQYNTSTSDAEVPHHSPGLAPATLHRVHLTEGQAVSSSNYSEAIASCHQLHPKWTHITWTDEAGAAFLRQYYPALWTHYTNYPRTVQKANILRYAVLEHYGGVYLDMDITCLRPLDSLRRLPFLAPAAFPAGVSNGFMVSRAQHPLLKQALDGVITSHLRWGLPYVEIMLTTGCMFLSNQRTKFMSRTTGSDRVLHDRDKVFILADEDGKVGPHMLRGAVTTSLFRHGGASSWHEWDAAVVVFVARHARCFGAVFMIGLVGTAMLVCRGRRRIAFSSKIDKLAKKRMAATKSSEDDMKLFV